MAKQDILLGYGKLWYAPLATANPDETTVAYGAAWSSWTALGETLEPLTLNWNEERVAVRTQQRLGILEEFRTALEPVLTTVVAEHTGVNLALILGGTNANTAAGGAQKGFSQVTVGEDFYASKYKVGFETLRIDTAGASQPVRYFFHICSIMPDGESTYDKENPTGVPIAIHVLEDTSQAAGSEFCVIDIVTAATT